MAQIYNGGFVCVNAVGVNVTTGAASQLVNVPVDASGNRPNYVRIAATTESYVSVRGTATTGDILVQPADALILQIPKGVTQIAYIQGTSAGKVNIVPLDNS